VTRSTLEVDLSAVRANAQRLLEAAGRSRLWAVVKADGYGHGAAACAGAALEAGAERVCCATLEEARELRTALGAAVPIIVLSPLEPGEETGAAGFEIAVSSLEGFTRLRAADVVCGVHVKADTGMGRWGMAPADALAVGLELAAARGPLQLAGVMSHLATSDDDPAFARVQAAAFEALAREFPPCLRHLANSAAALTLPETHYDAVRCGIALYGVSPFDGDPAEHGLTPALRWTSRVAGLRDLSPGQSAGYGRRLIADRSLRVAYVPVGYADGYPRLASGRSEILVRGRRRRVAANVSMDQLTCIVDGEVELGDEVVLIGVQADERITAEELAGHAETIGYEIVCDTALAARRGRRSYVEGPSQ
jgi:alanine racemase